jgi:hypothetical protein
MGDAEIPNCQNLFAPFNITMDHKINEKKIAFLLNIEGMNEKRFY